MTVEIYLAAMGLGCFIAILLVVIGIKITNTDAKKDYYEKKLPLNEKVICTVDREKLNKDFFKLSKVEKQLLYKRISEVYIGRIEGNVLIVCFDEKPSKLLEKPSKTNWVRYLERGYFKFD